MVRHPEFEEYSVHYPIKHSKHSSHSYAVEWAGSHHAILDVGCGKGFLAEELIKNDNHVTGIDILPKTAVLPALEQYYQADLDTASLISLSNCPASTSTAFCFSTFWNTSQRATGYCASVVRLSRATAS